MNAIQKGITMLLRSGITGEHLVLPGDFELAQAYDVLCRHSVAPLAYHGALNCGIGQTEPVMQKLFRLYYTALVRSERQIRTLEELFSLLEEHKIAFMPLKGCNMKKLYPAPELRAMGDADILIHPEDHDRIAPLMEEAGLRFDSENEHVFVWRSDALYAELHKSMIPPDDEDYYAYYGTGWRLARKGGTSRHDLSAEDAYLFMFTHFARHYRFSGIGCRHVTDLFVYRSRFPDMDWRYIRRELKKLNLLTFHENAVRMVDAWFADGQEDEITELMTEFIFSGGNWGTFRRFLISSEAKEAEKKGVRTRSKTERYFEALFPPYTAMVKQYPWLKRRAVLLPAAWLVRAAEVLFKRPGHIREKFDSMNSFKSEDVCRHNLFLRRVGLSYGVCDQNNEK